MNRTEHWQKVYKSKAPTEVSWYQPHLQISLDLVLESGASKDAKIIDVGGGTSTLVGDLMAKGYGNITVLDLSSEGLKVSKERLGNRENHVTWIEGDITCAELPPCFYDFWHDRAVFHFLTDPLDRKKYVQKLNHSLRENGSVIISTFSLTGPERCSGLNVVRYSPETLMAELGENYRLIKSMEESHQTPFGTRQEFVYCIFKRTEMHGFVE